jgi:hypothetical protein
MPPQRNAKRTYNEGTLYLAIEATKATVPDSTKHASKAFEVPETTLRRRRDGKLPRGDCVPNSKKLKETEGEAIVTRILELDARGIGATRAMVEGMANDLLAARGEGPVGKHWVDRFKTRTKEIKLRRSRPYDHQRAMNEDARVITRWFELVRETKEKYGILDEDIHNFDESGFMMGVIKSQMVFTASEKRTNPKKIQPGNREWVTIIQGICAAGWAIPPFVIFSGKVLISSWYAGMPRDWAIEVSPNGWTTDELALKWLKHFDAHTKEHTVGAYRLLIVDGHGSHNTKEFHEYCEEQKIIVLCMPPHSSHLLQPLDVGCFAPMKRAYYTEIESWSRYAGTQVKKETFLPAFRIAFDKAITKDNILASFRGAGLVPHDPERVLSKLDVVLRTPTPPPSEAIPWESKTPTTLTEIEAQTTLVRERMQRHRESPISPLLKAIDSLAKGMAVIGHKSELQTREIAGLRKAINALTEQRSRKRKYIRTEESLTVGDVQDLMAGKDGGDGEAPEQSAKRVRAQRHCGRCGKTGHNTRTCTAEIVDSDDSYSSE